MKRKFPFMDRVDNAILCASHRLGRARSQTLRSGIGDFRQTCIDYVREFPGEDARIWDIRRERCDLMLYEPDDAVLRRRADEALRIEADND